MNLDPDCTTGQQVSSLERSTIAAVVVVVLSVHRGIKPQTELQKAVPTYL